MMRDYEATPRPAVEYHPHIRELIEAQEKRSEDRNYHRAKEKAATDRESEIKEAKVLDLKDFYCRKCKEDFYRPATKQIEVDWNNPLQRIAFYQAKHRKCGNWCIRLITDRQRDAYWIRSKQVRRDQGQHANDMLQPWQEGFNLLYGKGP